MTTGCRFCDYGPVPGSSTGQHLDLLLPDYRAHRRSGTPEARKADAHPLRLIQFARSKIDNGRGIAWDNARSTPAEQRVLDAFAAHVVVPRVNGPHNPLYTRCPPAWWIVKVDGITAMYTANRDYEAMLLAVQEVLEVARRLMHELEYRERPAPALNIRNWQNVTDNVVTGALNTVEAAGSVRDTVAARQQHLKPEADDEEEYRLPPPPKRRERNQRPGPRNKGPIETISLLSSSPPRAAPAAPAAAAPTAPVVFTLLVNIMGANVHVPVTMGMSMQDAIAAAVAGSVLRALDPAEFVVADTDGGAWSVEKWNEVWSEAFYGVGGEWKVQLLMAGK